MGEKELALFLLVLQSIIQVLGYFVPLNLKVYKPATKKYLKRTIFQAVVK